MNYSPFGKDGQTVKQIAEYTGDDDAAIHLINAIEQLGIVDAMPKPHVSAVLGKYSSF